MLHHFYVRTPAASWLRVFFFSICCWSSRPHGRFFHVAGDPATAACSRILADEKRAQAFTSRAARNTQQAYRASYKRVLREMEGLYAQAQSGGAVTRTQLWRYSHWRGMTEELRKFASSGAALEEQRLTKVLDQVFSNTIGADVKAFAQKQWRTRLNASSVVNTAWSGENYSTRIWRNRALLASRVREEVTQAVLDGKPVNRIAADLQSAFSSSWSQAERLARTETSYVFNQASLRRYAELGIKQVRWITGINDGRECEVCAERSGQVYDLNNAPMMPAHPNCRCAWGAVVEEEEHEPLLEESDESIRNRNNEQKLTGVGPNAIIYTGVVARLNPVNVSTIYHRPKSDIVRNMTSAQEINEYFATTDWRGQKSYLFSGIFKELSLPQQKEIAEAVLYIQESYIPKELPIAIRIQKTATVNGERVAGYYDSKKRKIVISLKDNSANGELYATVIHELIHHYDRYNDEAEYCVGVASKRLRRELNPLTNQPYSFADIQLMRAEIASSQSGYDYEVLAYTIEKALKINSDLNPLAQLIYTLFIERNSII